MKTEKRCYQITCEDAFNITERNQNSPVVMDNRWKSLLFNQKSMKVVSLFVCLFVCLFAVLRHISTSMAISAETSLNIELNTLKKEKELNCRSD
jgi:hypothetical protein